jgi:uncharacterized membrane protein
MPLTVLYMLYQWLAGRCQFQWPWWRPEWPSPENYGYKYFTITNHLASFTNDASYISTGDIRRLGLIGVIAVLAVLIFKLVLPNPRK